MRAGGRRGRSGGGPAGGSPARARLPRDGRPPRIAGAARAVGLALALAVAASPHGTRVPAVPASGTGAVAPAPPSTPVPPPSPEALPYAVRASVAPQESAPYDGRFTFTRVRYGSGGVRGWGRRGGGAWAHDYPDADLNLQTILEELTAVEPSGRTNVLDLEDPGIFRHPVLYMAEPGFWQVTEEGAANLRQHLLKGGLIVFDDFEAGQWFNFEAQVRRVLPERELVEIGPDHPVFDSFFFVEDIYVPHPLVRVTPRYFGVFEDDDPSRRMMMLVNYNSDLAEYWEWSATGQFGVDPTNDAYRLGVNYVVYALTH